MSQAKVIPMPPPPPAVQWPGGWPGPNCPPSDGCGCGSGGMDWSSLQSCFDQIRSFQATLATMLSQMQVSSLGVTDGTEAAPGQVGEMVVAQGATTLAMGSDGTVYVVVNSLTLSPGDWQITANYWIDSVAGSTFTELTVGLMPTTIPLSETINQLATPDVAWSGETAGTSMGGTVGPTRQLQSTTVAADLRVNLIGTGSGSFQWAMMARRMR